MCRCRVRMVTGRSVQHACAASGARAARVVRAGRRRPLPRAARHPRADAAAHSRSRRPAIDIQTTDIAEQRALTLALDSSYLFIQGPPGTGKTWTGARLITELMRRGRRVGVTATSHKAIHNLLDEVERAAIEEGLSFRGIKKAGDSEESRYDSASISSVNDVAEFPRAGTDVQLFAGTAWLFAHDALDGTVDTLVIDEAGQVSLADALAMGTAARNVVLLGDPLQLAQVSQGTHPPGTGCSVLEHLLGDDATIPPSMGLFLERTRRMHPDVCRFISEIVYDNRLTGVPELERQTTAFGTGLRFLPVDHSGNAAASSEEAAAIAAEVGKMVGSSWTDRNGATQTAAPGRLHGRGAVQRAGAPPSRSLAGAPISATSRSGPSTSSRGAKRRCCSTRWRRRASRTFRAASSSSSRATG